MPRHFPPLPRQALHAGPSHCPGPCEASPRLTPVHALLHRRPSPVVVQKQTPTVDAVLRVSDASSVRSAMSSGRVSLLPLQSRRPGLAVRRGTRCNLVPQSTGLRRPLLLSYMASWEASTEPPRPRPRFGITVPYHGSGRRNVLRRSNSDRVDGALQSTLHNELDV
ncbi:hypothetical protein ACQJBY_069075 [Aegilops geniculata]